MSFAGDWSPLREEILADLARDFQVSLWGPWKKRLARASILQDRIAKDGFFTPEEMVGIFNRSQVALNIHTWFGKWDYGLNPRVFEANGCGVFQLCDFKEEIPEHFEAGKEIALYRSVSELKDKLAYYLGKPEELTEIAAQGYVKTHRDHTYARRLKEMFSRCGLGWKSAVVTLLVPRSLWNTFEEHQRWLESEGKEGCRADLRSGDLSKLNLQGINLARAILTNVVFTGAILRSADLTEASLQGAYLKSADLHWANLSGANLEGADLTGAQLQFANFDSANLVGACLKGAFLHNAWFWKANCHGADFSQASLNFTSFRSANLKESKFEQTKLQQTDMRNADLRESSILLAEILSADFHGANLPSDFSSLVSAK